MPPAASVRMQPRLEEDAGVRWLLSSGDPSVRFRTLTEIVGRSAVSPRAASARRDILAGPRVAALLAGQQADGGFGVHPYQKWTGAHWRLVALVDLALPADHPAAMAAAEQVLEWLTGPGHRRGIRVIEGLTRRCASQEGAALGVCSHLEMTADRRVRELAEAIVAWQWPDGGWNCDITRSARHSSFHESLATAWGLVQHHWATGDPRSFAAARRAAEFFLRHRLFRSERTGDIADPKWLCLRYPPYWHYTVLRALDVLGSLGLLADPRAEEALDMLESKRRPDGTWPVEGAFWRRVGDHQTHSEVVDWGRSGPNEMVTFHALRVLRMADRL